MIKPLMRWLRQPGASDVERSRNLSKNADDIDGLVRLAQFDWDVGGLRRLAAGAARMRQSADGRQSLERSHLLPVRVLIICNATAQHLSEPLVGTGLRHGLLLDTMISEYEEPEVFPGAKSREDRRLRAGHRCRCHGFSCLCARSGPWRCDGCRCSRGSRRGPPPWCPRGVARSAGATDHFSYFDARSGTEQASYRSAHRGVAQGPRQPGQRQGRRFCQGKRRSASRCGWDRRGRRAEQLDVAPLLGFGEIPVRAGNGSSLRRASLSADRASIRQVASRPRAGPR